jgi:dihydrofolate reductase
MSLAGGDGQFRHEHSHRRHRPQLRGGPVSLDGFAAGPNQSEELPFGEGLEDEQLHTWMFDHVDQNRAEVDAILGAGAYIMGRNMFSPGRGEWDLDWKGWWLPEPPYHAPVFVLSHHRREPLEMDGGTTFTFVTDGPESALAQARRAAGDGRGQAARPRSTSTCHSARSTSSGCTSCRSHSAQASGFDGVPGLTFDIGHVRPTEHVVHVTLRLPGR